MSESNSAPRQRNFRSPRALDARARPLANMTIPQLLAVVIALGIGAVLWWALGALPFIRAGTLWALVGRMFISGTVAGVLAVVFYALADDQREPVVRQAITYLFRRHSLRQETINGSHVISFPRLPRTGSRLSVAARIRAAIHTIRAYWIAR